MSNETIYQNVLEKLNCDDFEKLCETLLQYCYPDDEIQFPTRSGTQDGGEDAFSNKTKTKDAFSIQKNWKPKVSDEIKKCIEHNLSCPTARREKLVDMTNGPEPEWNDFLDKWKKFLPGKDFLDKRNKLLSSKNILDVSSIGLEKIDLETLSSKLEEYFKHNSNLELF